MDARHGLRSFGSLSILAVFSGVGWCQVKTQDAVQGVIAAFKSANLVALGERHWAREDSEFRLKLIRDPAFGQTVTDIVIEFANPLYQDLLDRYVNGGLVPSTDLRKIWQDTTQPMRQGSSAPTSNHIWPSPEAGENGHGFWPCPLANQALIH